MQAQYPAVRAAGAEVIAVSQSRPDVLRNHLRLSPRPFPVVCDPDRVVYRAFGLERGNWGMFFTGRALRRYLGLMLSGWRLRPVAPGEDVLQRGGDFVLDGNRRLVFAHRSEDPGDRPTVAQLLRALDAVPHDAAPF